MIITPLTWLCIGTAFLAGLASPTLLCALKALGHRCTHVLRRVGLMVGSGAAGLLYASYGAVQNGLHRLDPLTFTPAPVGPAPFRLTSTKKGTATKRSRSAQRSVRQKRQTSLGQGYGRLLYHARFSIVGLWLVLLVAAIPLVVRLPGELSTNGDTMPGSQASIQLHQLAAHFLAVVQATHPEPLQVAMLAASALLFLLLVFGSAAAATLSLMLAAGAIGTVLATLSLVALVIPVTREITGLVVLLNLAFALVFSAILSRRFRKEVGRHPTIAEASATSLSTAGVVTFFSGLAVLIGFAGLLFLGDPGMKRLAVGGIVSVSMTVCAVLTLLPALLAILGQRVNVLPVVPARVIRLHNPKPWRRAYKHLEA